MKFETGTDYVGSLQEIALPSTDAAAAVRAVCSLSARVLHLGSALAIDAELPVSVAFLTAEETPDGDR